MDFNNHSKMKYCGRISDSCCQIRGFKLKFSNVVLKAFSIFRVLIIQRKFLDIAARGKYILR